MRLKSTVGDVVTMSREEFDTCRYVAAQLLLHERQARPLVDILEAIHARTSSECSAQMRRRSGVVARFYSRLRSLVGAA